MKDVLIIALIYSVFSAFNVNLFAQENAPPAAPEMENEAAPAEEEELDFDDFDTIEAERPSQRKRSVNIETVNFNGVKKNTLTIVDPNGEVSVIEWDGETVPPDIQAELERKRIDLSTLKALERGEDVRSTVTYRRTKPDAPELEVIREEVIRDENGKERTTRVRADRRNYKKEVTILMEDGAEKSYRWEGVVPKSIHDEIARIDSVLLEHLLHMEDANAHMSLGAKLNYDVEKSMINGVPEESTMVTITEVIPGGNADLGGLKRGDLILSIDGVEVGRSNSVYELLAKRNQGDTVEIIFLRGSEEQTAAITLHR